MQSLPNHWYKRLNYVLGMGLLLLLGLYTAVSYADIGLTAGDLGFTPLSVALLGLGAATSLVVGPILSRKSALSSALISFFVTSAAVGVVAVLSGGLDSIMYPLIIALGFVSGMFGYVVAIMYGIGAIVGITLELLGLTAATASPFKSLMLILTNLVVITTGYLVWRSHFLSSAQVKDKQLTSLTTRLQTEQLRSEILINSIGEGVIATDVNGKIQLINPAASTITDWEHDDALNLDVTTILRLLIIDDNDNETEVASQQHPFVQAISSGQTITVNDSMLSTHTDKRVELTMTVSPISIDDTVQGAVGVFRDVTEQRRQERQRAEFISTASHEMRTPVAAIEGYLALAMNPNVAQVDDKARGYLVKAYDSTKHLGQLFKDLLTAAKSEDGRLTNHPEVVELNSLLEKITDDLRFTAEEKGLELRYTPAASTDNRIKTNVVAPLYYVYVDPERLREVITNLLSNAVKFTNDGQITVGLKANEEAVQISVSDTGFGIPKEDIPHLFQKFYRVDNSATRTIGGTGLGLFISRNIIELYKGRIWVESAFGKGSTFYISLPRLDAQRAKQLQTSTTVNNSVRKT